MDPGGPVSYRIVNVSNNTKETEMHDKKCKPSYNE